MVVVFYAFTPSEYHCASALCYSGVIITRVMRWAPWTMGIMANDIALHRLDPQVLLLLHRPYPIRYGGKRHIISLSSCTGSLHLDRVGDPSCCGSSGYGICWLQLHGLPHPWEIETKRMHAPDPTCGADARWGPEMSTKQTVCISARTIR